jgi:hypothetical protein
MMFVNYIKVFKGLHPFEKVLSTAVIGGAIGIPCGFIKGSKDLIKEYTNYPNKRIMFGDVAITMLGESAIGASIGAFSGSLVGIYLLNPVVSGIVVSSSALMLTPDLIKMYKEREK